MVPETNTQMTFIKPHRKEPIGKEFNKKEAEVFPTSGGPFMRRRQQKVST